MQYRGLMDGKSFGPIAGLFDAIGVKPYGGREDQVAAVGRTLDEILAQINRPATAARPAERRTARPVARSVSDVSRFLPPEPVTTTSLDRISTEDLIRMIEATLRRVG
jgi:hypothetical protein